MVVAARGSRLSLAQTGVVTALLGDATSFDVRTITTQGDTDSRPLFAMDRRGMFEREVNQAVLDGRADFAVHSMKDVPNDMSTGLVLASVPRRADPFDVLVCRPDLDVNGPFVVGTSSLRRAAQARIVFPQATVRPVRGNVDTRISRIGDTLDAVILARAGLGRLGLDVHEVRLPDAFIPSPGQGALALVCRSDDHDTISLLRGIHDAASYAAVVAERSMSAVLESGCRFPVAAYARHDGVIRMRAAAYDTDGQMASTTAEGADPESVGRQAGRDLLDKGAASFALKWRRQLDEWR